MTENNLGRSIKATLNVGVYCDGNIIKCDEIGVLINTIRIPFLRRFCAVVHSRKTSYRISYADCSACDGNLMASTTGKSETVLNICFSLNKELTMTI